MAYRSIDDLLLLLLVALLLTRWKWLLAALTVFGAGVLLMSTNAQDAGLRLSVVLCVLMAGSVRTQAERVTRAACALAAGLLLAASASLDAVSLAQAVREKPTPPAGAGRFLPAHMSGLLLYDLGRPSFDLAYSNGARYASYINSGLRLLQAESKASESVATLEQYNPFSYALLRKPGRGGFAFLAYGYSFSSRHQPPVERLFAGADLIMVPKRNFTDHFQNNAILETYLPGIQAMFTLAAETPEWWLYRRKK